MAFLVLLGALAVCGVMLMMAYWPHLGLLLFVLVMWGLEKKFPRFMSQLEENVLVLVMALIMCVSCGQVIARYGFNTGWSAALEFNTIAFSWLILLGMSYGIKTGIHLGVDVVLNKVPPPLARILSLIGAFAAILYGLILLDSRWLSALGVDVRGGAIAYWVKMYKINIGADELRYPEFIQQWFAVKPRVQRWLLLVILPIGLSLVVYRSCQAFVAILMGKRSQLIRAYEAHELANENKDALKD